MSKSKFHFQTVSAGIIGLVLLFGVIGLAGGGMEVRSPHEENERQSRWVKLDGNGLPVGSNVGPWACVFDRQTGLVWEVKTWQENEQYYKATYSWYAKPQSENNLPVNSPVRIGSQKLGSCHRGRDFYSCDTSQLVDYVKEKRICGIDSWRIPRLEELQTLYYAEAHDGQVRIDKYLFPQTFRTPYWTADVVRQKKKITDDGTLNTDVSSHSDSLNQKFKVLTLNFYNGEVQALPSDVVATLRLVASTENREVQEINH